MQPLRDGEQHGVARSVAEAVIDQLEFVQVHEQDRERGPLASRPGHGMPDALHEQRPVGQIRDGIVERLVRELLLERFAFAHIAPVEDDALDVLIVQQVRVEHLEASSVAVAVTQRALEDLRNGGHGGGPIGQQMRQTPLLARLEQQVEPGSDDVIGRVAEHALDGRALIDDRAFRVQHRDEVADVLDEGRESCLAGAAVDLFGERRALERERDLGRERRKAVQYHR